MNQLRLFPSNKTNTRTPANTHGPRYRLRYYQQNALDQAIRLIQEKSKGILVRAATGCGKTFTGIAIMDWWLKRSPYHRAIVISHERQLVYQFAQEIQDITGSPPSIEMGMDRIREGINPRVVVASRASLYRREIKGRLVDRLGKFDPNHPWLIIIDEVHRHLRHKLSSCRDIYDWFEQNPESVRLGLTATARRSDKRSLSELCPDIALDYPLFSLDQNQPNAVQDGYAVPYRQKFVQVEGVDWKDIRVSGKDFDEGALGEALAERRTLLSFVQPTLDLVGKRRTLIFSPTVAMARAVAVTISKELRDDQCVLQIDGSTPPGDRRRAYALHQAGRIQFLSVCGLCREGYNDPGIQAVAIFRPTKHVGLAEQMRGRGCRVLPGVVDKIDNADDRRAAIAESDKPDCMIVDLVGMSGLRDTATTAHILAHGLPDKFIEKVNKKLLDKPDADITTEVLSAQERYKQWERYVADISKLKGDVRYASHDIDGPARLPQYRQPYARMPFGKFKGKLFTSLPDWYLKWLIKLPNLSDRLKPTVLDEAARRHLSLDSTPAKHTRKRKDKRKRHGKHKQQQGRKTPRNSHLSAQSPIPRHKRDLIGQSRLDEINRTFQEVASRY